MKILSNFKKLIVTTLFLFSLTPYIAAETVQGTINVTGTYQLNGSTVVDNSGQIHTSTTVYAAAVQYPDGSISTTASGSSKSTLSKPITFTWTKANPNYPVGQIPNGDNGIQNVAIADDSGGVWVLSNTPAVIRYTSQGVPTTISGLGTNPIAGAFDGTNMWVVNGSDPFIGDGDNSVSVVGPNGVIVTYTGIGNGLSGIAWDGFNFWLTDLYDDQITVLSPTGNNTVTTSTCSANGVVGLNSIAFDGIGNMWAVGLNAANQVVKITSGCVATSFSVSGVGNLYQIAFDGTNMWAVDENNSHITKIAPNSTYTTFGNMAGPEPALLTFDGTYFWVTDLTIPALTRVALDGTLTNFTLPFSVLGRGIAFDGNNSVWESVPGSSFVQKIRIK